MGSTKLLLLCNGFITGDSAALVPVTHVLPVILHNKMSYTTCTLTDQSSNTAVGSTKLSPLCNGFITGDSAALVPVTLVIPVILHNNMSYTTCTLTDQSSNTAVGSTKLSPLCNGFITGATTEQIKNLPV